MLQPKSCVLWLSLHTLQSNLASKNLLVQKQVYHFFIGENILFSKSGKFHFIFIFFNPFLKYSSIIIISLSLKTMFHLGKGSKKNLCKFTHLGGWMFQEWDKLHRKNMPLKSILDHFKSFQTNFFLPFLGGGWVRPGHGQPALESDFLVTSLRV